MLNLPHETDLLNKHFRAAVNDIPIAHFDLLPVDKLFGGVRPGRLCFICGGPGSAKTTLLGQLGDGLAQGGCPVLFFTFEVSPAQLVAKSLARLGKGAFTLSEIPGSSANPRVSEKVKVALEAYRETIAPNMFFFENVHTAKEIGAYVTACEAQLGKKPVVLLDYLQIVGAEADSKYIEERLVLRDIISSLRRICNMHEICVIAISSINRQSYGKDKFDLSCLGGCSFAEFSADLVVSLVVDGKDKEERAENMAKAKRPVTLSILKNRYGNVSEASLILDTKHALFEDGSNDYPYC